MSLIIKTFERPLCLKRLLQSIRSQALTGCPILVADDSRTPYEAEIMAEYDDVVDIYLSLPFNSGVSAGRNALLDAVQTPYFVLNDDDFFYGPETNLAAAVKQLNNEQLDILGGYLLEQKRIYTWPALPKRISNLLNLYSNEWKLSEWMAALTETDDGGIAVTREERHTPLQRCDLTHNFFIARTHSVRDVVGGWHAPLKSIGEHWEFFYRCKQAGLKVGHTRAFGIYHHAEAHESSNEYTAFRYGREQEMISRSLQRHNLQYLQRGTRVIRNQYAQETTQEKVEAE